MAYGRGDGLLKYLSLFENPIRLFLSFWLCSLCALLLLVGLPLLRPEQNTQHSQKKPSLWTLQKFICPSAEDCGFGRRNSLITQRRTEECQIKQTRTEQNTVVFKWGTKQRKTKKKKKEEKPDGQGHTTAGTDTHILTSMTGGSSVACSITGTAENVPRLFTPAAVFTVIRHAPGQRKREKK